MRCRCAIAMGRIMGIFLVSEAEELMYLIQILRAHLRAIKQLCNMTPFRLSVSRMVWMKYELFGMLMTFSAYIIVNSNEC